MKHYKAALAAATACALAGAGMAHAQEATQAPASKPDAATAAAAAPAAPKAWSDTLKVSGWVEAGATFNNYTPKPGVNFGHLFTDRANQGLLNQVGLTVERPIDPKSTTTDIGFRFQGMYGSDARYTHFLGILDNTNERNQFDIVEANVQMHAPILTPGGVDIKVGQYVTLEGFEVIPAAGNTFYSKSYIFNFGIPLKHTGVMTVTHVNPMFDLYLGVDAGVNTFIGHKDNNRAAAFHGGFGLNLDKLTILATTHIGPENALGTPGVRPNHDLRYLNDIVVTYKPSDKLTWATDLNYIKDDGFNASGYGVAQYVTYAMTSQLSLSARAEVWRDADGFFVAAFPGNQDFVNLEKGLPNGSFGGGKTTYGELTVGVTYKPLTSGPAAGLMIRPELRYDRSFNHTTPFDSGTKDSQFTGGFDVVLPIG